MGNYKGNSSSIGTASHTVPRYKIGGKKKKGNLSSVRRDRKRCQHYDAKSQLCYITFRKCVGPTICERFQFSKKVSL